MLTCWKRPLRIANVQWKAEGPLVADPRTRELPAVMQHCTSRIFVQGKGDLKNLRGVNPESFLNCFFGGLKHALRKTRKKNSVKENKNIFGPDFFLSENCLNLLHPVGFFSGEY